MRVLRLLLLAPGCSYPPSFLSSTLCGIFARSSFHCFSFSPCLHRLRDIHTPSFYSPPIVISRFLDTCRPRVNPAAPCRHIDPVPLIDFIHRDMCVRLSGIFRPARCICQNFYFSKEYGGAADLKAWKRIFRSIAFAENLLFCIRYDWK